MNSVLRSRFQNVSILVFTASLCVSATAQQPPASTDASHDHHAGHTGESSPKGDLAASATAAVDAFHRALGAGHREHVLSMLDPQVLIFESGGAETSRDEYSSHHLAADLQFAAATKAETKQRTTQVHGELAWVSSRSKTTGHWHGKDIDSDNAETILLRRSTDAPNGWLIIHIHWSSR